MKNVNIVVTAEDIEHGKAGSALSDPIALAISRELPKGWRVLVRPASILFSYRGNSEYLKVETPPVAAMLVRSLDRGMPVRPTQFGLDIPDDKDRPRASRKTNGDA